MLFKNLFNFLRKKAKITKKLPEFRLGIQGFICPKIEGYDAVFEVLNISKNGFLLKLKSQKQIDLRKSIFEELKHHSNRELNISLYLTGISPKEEGSFINVKASLVAFDDKGRIAFKVSKKDSKKLEKFYNKLLKLKEIFSYQGETEKGIETF